MEKALVTFHFCTSSDSSEKLPLWVISSVARPRAFARANINLANLDMYWRYNKTAWMIGLIFEEWLYWFNRRMSGRKVVLMDNFSAYEAAVQKIKDSQCPLQNTTII